MESSGGSFCPSAVLSPSMAVQMSHYQPGGGGPVPAYPSIFSLSDPNTVRAAASAFGLRTQAAILHHSHPRLSHVDISYDSPNTKAREIPFFQILSDSVHFCVDFEKKSVFKKGTDSVLFLTDSV